jgi:hypothetical protein
MDVSKHFNTVLPVHVLSFSHHRLILVLYFPSLERQIFPMKIASISVDLIRWARSCCTVFVSISERNEMPSTVHVHYYVRMGTVKGSLFVVAEFCSQYYSVRIYV